MDNCSNGDIRALKNMQKRGGSYMVAPTSKESSNFENLISSHAVFEFQQQQRI